MYIHIIYIYIYRERERERERERLSLAQGMHASIASHSFGVRLLTRFVRPLAWTNRKGTKGVSTNGVTANFMFFSTEGLFGCPHEPTFIFPNVPRCTFFPKLSKFSTFAAAPLALTPFVRNQTKPCRLRVYLGRLVEAGSRQTRAVAKRAFEALAERHGARSSCRCSFICVNTMRTNERTTHNMLP